MNSNNHRIRLLKFVTDFRIGGTERQFANLAKNIDRNRFELHVGCFRQMGDFLADVKESGAQVQDFPLTSLWSTLALRQQARLASYIRTNRIGIVHSYGFYPNVFAIPAARLAGAHRIVASIRDTGDHLTPARRRLQQWICRLADRVLVNAEAVRQRLLNDGYSTDKLTVVHNGIDLESFPIGPPDRRRLCELGLPESAPVVAVVSRLDALKGIEYFLEAARIVGERFPEACFLIVGDGARSVGRVSYRETLESLAARLDLAGRVVFAGSRCDVPELLGGVTISVLPSLSEGLSNALLESLAAGVPVVATRVGGNPEIVQDSVTGLLVPPRDARTLAAAIVALLSDPDRAARMGAAGRRSVETRFSLQAMVRATERFYEDLSISPLDQREGGCVSNPKPAVERPRPIRAKLREEPLSIEIVRDAERFGALREEWSALLASSAADTIFLTWEWLNTWWKHLSGRLRLEILAVWRGRELVAVAPLALRRLGLLPPRLEFLGTGTVGSDYLDIVAMCGREGEALEALVPHLEQIRVRLRWDNLRGEASVASELGAALEGEGFRVFRTRSETCPFISLASRSWESYLASLGREHRYNFKRRLRQLREASELRFERVSNEERRREALAILFDLHERRWKERGGSDAFPRREVVRFHEELSRLALDRGWLRLFVLWVSGEPAAALYGFRYRGTFSFYQSGFDPRFARRSVGLVMMGLAIQSAFEEGAEEFDFLHGAEAYKFLWARDRRELMRMEVDPPGTYALLLRAASEAQRAARRAARRLSMALTEPGAPG
jgi:glycosyltransferase involved in cell wall biosynthesis/CelD/BcsL family acetyltransferase involved in cellulose biosynthesis